MFLHTNQQIRDFENYLIQNNIYTEMQLMEAAGAAAFQQLKKYWPNAQRIIVCCGKGKNAGDGYILARLAHQHGLIVTVYSLAASDTLPAPAQQAAQAAKNVGVIIKNLIPPLFEGDIIVDAIFGSGLKGEVIDPYTSFMTAINASQLPILALDVPSGIEVDTGKVLGCAVRANATITFVGLKQGLLTGQAPAFTGKITVDSLGIKAEYFHQLPPSAQLLSQTQIKPLLPKRQRNANKGDYGHVLVIGGDYGMGGAVRMAAEAAMRVGAGLVSVATRPEHLPIISGPRPEIMCHQIIDAEDLQPLIAKATVIVIGPGLGKSDWSRALLHKVLSLKLPQIIDADGLNLLAEKPQAPHNDWILTPHPGEASRLLNCSVTDIQENRFTAAKNLQHRYGGVVVLKGAGTIIAGQADMPALCPAGNPGMASGGMGDVLSGILGGLVAQGLSLYSAAQVGVYIHALAADQVAANGGERGLLASDLLPYLRRLVNPE